MMEEKKFAGNGLSRREMMARTVWAGLGAIRRKAFEAIKGFDADRYPRPSIEDIELGDRLRRLEIRRQERMRDSARQFRMVLVDDGDRRIAHFLRAALRLRHDSEREAVDDQPQQHEIAHKAAQLLGTEPEDVGEGSHRGAAALAFLLAEQQ